jgi:hypothetical protein
VATLLALALGEAACADEPPNPLRALSEASGAGETQPETTAGGGSTGGGSTSDAEASAASGLSDAESGLVPGSTASTSGTDGTGSGDSVGTAAEASSEGSASTGSSSQGASATDATDTSASATSATDTDATDTSATDTFATDSSGTATTGDESTGGAAEFDPPEPFGDDVKELDLVGTWAAPSYGAVLSWDLELTWFADGRFTWVERDDRCGVVVDAAGVGWVDGTQLVLEVRRWDGPPPWDTASVVGVTFSPPFRLRLGFALQGSYLAFVGPDPLTASATWSGRAYARQNTGVGPQGSWVAEAELIAAPPGEVVPTVIARDRFVAELAAGGDGVVRHERRYLWPAGLTLPPSIRDGAWIDANPGQSAGAADVGGVTHAYDARSLITFTQFGALRRGARSDCTPAP